MHHNTVKQHQYTAALTQSPHAKKLHFGKGVDSICCLLTLTEQIEFANNLLVGTLPSSFVQMTNLGR